ncbi:MAG: hypothetical protein PHV59_04935 [Victivallales bacterium]|nr:hypothetical protein [Victivallales bacterium]
MNIQAINLKSAKRRRRTVSKSGVTGKIYIVAAFLLVFGGLAVCLNYRTWLNKNIARIDKESAQCNRKLHELDREIENLRLARESLSGWPHIRGRIAQLQLKLRLPASAQVQHFVVNYGGAAPRGATLPDNRVAMISKNR